MPCQISLKKKYYLINVTEELFCAVFKLILKLNWNIVL